MEGSSQRKPPSIDRSRLSRDQLLRHLGAVARVIAHFSAELERDLAALTDDPADEKDFARDEVALVLRWSAGYTHSRVVQAHKLVDQLPHTLEALSAGQIGPEHARAVAEACYGYTPDITAKVEKQVLERAPQQTVTELKRSLTRTVQRLDRASWEQRHQRAHKQRDVGLSLLPDGMAGIWSRHTTADAEQILAAVQKVADRSRGDDRLVGERRADALRDLILGMTAPAPAAKPVQHRPITIASAFRYEPCPALRAKVIARDITCRFPGCTRRAVTCEIDHIEDWNGYNTVEKNLHALCPRHHHLKTETDWLVQRLNDGTTQWTSPTGRIFYKPRHEPDDNDDEPP